MEERFRSRSAKTPKARYSHSGAESGAVLSMSFGRAELVDKLKGIGFSRRQSVQLVNATLEAIIQGLSGGERVELPLGTFSVDARKRRSAMEKQPQGKKANRKRSPVVLMLSDDVEKLLNPPAKLRRKIELPPRPNFQPKVEPAIRLNLTMKSLRKPVEPPKPAEAPPPVRRSSLPPMPPALAKRMARFSRAAGSSRFTLPPRPGKKPDR